jgi:serine/threonine-protein kinase
LATVHHLSGELDQAREHYEAALRIREVYLGRDHPDLAGVMNNLGSVLYGLGMNADAVASYTRAIEVWSKAHGDAFPDLAKPLNNLGIIYRELGRLDESLAAYQRAYAITEQAYGAEHLNAGYSLGGMGDVEWERGRIEEARAYYERALAVWEAGQMRETEVAVIRFSLARVLWSDAAAHTRALALARSAHDTFAEAPGAQERLAEIDAWLAEHG